MPTETIVVDAVLFDMDGTLIDSTPAVNATWAEFARTYSLDLDHVLQTCHGWRTVENLRRFVPSIPEGEALEAEVKRFEARIAEISDRAREEGKWDQTIRALPGARQLLESISAGEAAEPEAKAGWAIVTSATKAYAHRAFASSQASPHPPRTFVTSELCTRGKPHPQPYLLGAHLSGHDVRRLLVVEDAPPGVRSGRSAGAAYTLGLATTHDARRMWEAGADFVAQDLSCVKAEWRHVDDDDEGGDEAEAAPQAPAPGAAAAAGPGSANAPRSRRGARRLVLTVETLPRPSDVVAERPRRYADALRGGPELDADADADADGGARGARRGEAGGAAAEAAGATEAATAAGAETAPAAAAVATRGVAAEPPAAKAVA